jgi:sugar/nucleoside kinase (ribokinase family)
VTLGPAGCQVCADDFEGHVEGQVVVAVDGTGAGDAFTAGFLYGRLAGWPTERCARFANAAGALATTAIGAFEGVGDLQQTLELAGAA